MSGETEQQVSGWTTDTLHIHMQRQFDAMETLIAARTGAIEKQLQKQIDDLQEQIGRRFAQEARAVDIAFNIHREHTRETLIASEAALQASLLGAEKAVTTALASAEKAVDKAETANEKRFESVNEFRGQLADQSRLFMIRSEANAIVAATNDRLSSESLRVHERIEDLGARLGDASTRFQTRMSELELRVTSRLDTLAGQTSATKEARDQHRLDGGQLMAIIGTLVAIISIAATIIIATR